MSYRIGALLAASAMAAATAFAAEPVSLPTINDSMTKVMSVHAQTIWDVSSHAFNKRGDGLVSSRVSAKDWRRLAEAGRELKARGLLLANNHKALVIAGPGEHIMGEDASHGGTKGTWDAASPKQIKTLIAANPALFTKRANILVETGAALEKASKTRDIKTLYRVSSNLDEVCDGCHQPFWGTDEPPPVSKAVKAMRPLGG